MQASHINAQQGSLLLILGTTMQFGYGPVQTLCTAHTQHAICPHCIPRDLGDHPHLRILNNVWNFMPSFRPPPHPPRLGLEVSLGGGASQGRLQIMLRLRAHARACVCV